MKLFLLDTFCVFADFKFSVLIPPEAFCIERALLGTAVNGLAIEMIGNGDGESLSLNGGVKRAASSERGVIGSSEFALGVSPLNPAFKFRKLRILCLLFAIFMLERDSIHFEIAVSSPCSLSKSSISPATVLPLNA